MVGSIVGGLLGSSSTSKAASQIAQASEYAAQLSYQTAQETAARLQPYTQAGYTSLAQYQAATGAQGPAVQSGTLSALSGGQITSPVFSPTVAQLQSTPGYQWNLNQALRGVENSASAQGRGISGPALQGAAAAATNLANSTLGTQQQIFQSNLSNVLSPLQYLTTTGQNAAATTGSALQSGATSAGNFLTSGATSSGQLNVLGSNYLSAALSNSLNNFSTGLVQGLTGSGGTGGQFG